MRPTRFDFEKAKEEKQTKALILEWSSKRSEVRIPLLEKAGEEEELRLVRQSYFNTRLIIFGMMSTKGFAFSRELQLSQMCKRLLFDCAENFKVFNPLGRRCSTAVEWTPSEKNLRGRGFRSYRVLGFFSLSLSSTFCVLNKVLRGVATLLIFLIHNKWPTFWQCSEFRSDRKSPECCSAGAKTSPLWMTNSFRLPND